MQFIWCTHFCSHSSQTSFIMKVTNFLTTKWIKQNQDGLKTWKESHRGFAFHCVPPKCHWQVLSCIPSWQKTGKAKFRWIKYFKSKPYRTCLSLPPQEMRPSTEKCFHCSCTLMCPDMSVDVPWYVCWRALICLLTSPDMSVDVPWYVCWCALICLPTCPYMFANMPWYVVCQRAL